MLREERHQRILELLRRDGKVIATALSATLEVSEDTIRRDLRELGEAGRLQRVHGGALPPTPASATYRVRLRQSVEAKQAIALAAIRLLRPGQLVLLDAGTTTLQLAQELPPDFHATIVTTSPAIAVALADHPTVDVLMIGGHLAKGDLAVTGAATIEALHRIRADVCMLGVCSIHPEAGLTAFDLEEAYAKRAMIVSAAEVVALADAPKLGTAAPYVVGPIDALTHLITDQTVADEQLAPYRAAGITVLRA
jgi:DeoR/GlpR family transcriptional regulator of sugar metabolism